MSQGNVDKITRAIAAFNAGDGEGMLADFHPDVEWRDLQHAPDVQERVRGIDSVRRILEQWNDAFDEFTAEIDEYIDAGDCVVTSTHWHAIGKGSGMVLDLRAADVYRFKDGQVVGVTQGYPDKETALESLTQQV
jgi:ketosteroid isomerase-like protein